MNKFLNDSIAMLENIEKDCSQSIIKKDYKTILEIQYTYVIELYNKYKDKLNIILSNTDFGTNLVFIGMTGNYFFPAVFWYVQSFKKVKVQFVALREDLNLTFNDLQFKISELIINNLGNRKGYNVELLESLYFYTTQYMNEIYYTDAKIDENFTINNYNPKYLSTFSKDIFKSNFENIHLSLNLYPIPNHNFWNLSAIFLEPDFNINFLEEKLPVFPFWTVFKNSKPIFNLYRISPLNFIRKSKFKYSMVNSFNFFINFKFFEKSKSELYQFSPPDLFKLFETFENQNFTFNEENSSAETISSPNWSQKISNPTKFTDQSSILKNIENEKVAKLIYQNLNLIISMFNTHRTPQSINIREIFEEVYRKNVFNNLFYKRYRLDKHNLNSDIIIWIKIVKRSRLKFKTCFNDFFSAIFTTGFIIEYESGLLIYLSINSEIKKIQIEKIREFLELFSLQYEIYDDFSDFGFHVYQLPPSKYFVENEWKFPLFKLKIDIEDYKNYFFQIVEEEVKFLKKDNNKNKIKKFEDFIINF